MTKPPENDEPHGNISKSLLLEATARLDHDNGKLTLNWPDAEDEYTKVHITISHADSPVKKRRLSITGNSYCHRSLQSGHIYQYSLKRKGANRTQRTYLYGGFEIPLEEERGAIILIIEKELAAALPAELALFERDLLGDGWRVIRHEASADDLVNDIKELIMQDCMADTQVNSVLLLGHLPVAYSGNIFPDGHPEHRGAWPADLFYGELSDNWSDEKNVASKAIGRQHNVAHDGKYDQSVIPSQVTLAVGRVDFHDLPAFSLDETQLMRQYLARNHAYRHKEFAVATEGLIFDGFPERPEAFAGSAWQNFTSLLGKAQVSEGHWFIDSEKIYALQYSCGPGGFTGGGGLGSTEEVASKAINGIFAPIFGSYFADWDSGDNLMRAVLANSGYPLATFWDGRPHWYLQAMGMGKTIGYCTRLTQNNAGEFQPVGKGKRGIHISLLGDPTLRLHIVAPPTDFIAESIPAGTRLNWKASAEHSAHYHLYRANNECGPYQKIASHASDSCQLVDKEGKAGDWYMIKAVILQPTVSGSYYNASQGIFVRFI